MKLSSNPEYANISSTIVQSPSGLTIANITVDLAYNLLNSTIFLTFAIPKDKADQKFEKIILKSSFNVCRMLQGNAGNFIGKTFLELFQKYADFELKCPFRKVKFTQKYFED